MGKMKAIFTEFQDRGIKISNLFYCFLCHKVRDKEEHGSHEDPFDPRQKICTRCHEHHEMLKKEEQDDWYWYDNQ